MNRVVIGLGSCGVAAGGRQVRSAIESSLRELSVDAEITATGCNGLCFREVMVELHAPGRTPCLVGDVTPDAVPDLLSGWFTRGEVPAEQVIGRGDDLAGEAAFTQRQQRIVLARCGRVDPDSLDDYLASGGYAGLKRALLELDPAGIIDEVEAAGLRGRGGAGFPTATKWRLARQAKETQRYVICNADEGDPGAFMDRNLVEADPYAVLEGLSIAARAIGAQQGFVYVRQEYPLAVERFTNAVQRARQGGWLGEDIAGSGWSFDVQIRRGAGAFVCGEETALIASLEGRRGIPRRRPPYPVERGFAGKPTSINNVETCAAVAWILANGAEGFARHGIGTSRGTKIFSLAGDIRRGGMVEVPMGITIGEIVNEIGGGSPSGRPIKAVQIGGPSGGCLPASLFDTPIDYESLLQTGAIMGSGSLIAMDEGCCMVDVARYFLAFTQDESCGHCTFCRIGTRRMLDILDRLCAGKGKKRDLDNLEALGRHVLDGSMCGLGGSAPNPVMTTLRYFRHEYEAHLDGRCPAAICRELIAYRIDPTLCDGCTLCLDQCTMLAIAPSSSAIPLTIDPETCTRCGGCMTVCRFEAVVVQ